MFSLPKMPNMHRIYMVLANPYHTLCVRDRWDMANLIQRLDSQVGNHVSIGKRRCLITLLQILQQRPVSVALIQLKPALRCVACKHAHKITAIRQSDNDWTCRFLGMLRDSWQQWTCGFLFWKRTCSSNECGMQWTWHPAFCNCPPCPQCNVTHSPLTHPLI